MNTHTHTHTELEFPTVPVFWFNTDLCDDNGKTIVQKLWVIEQMDCGRAGLVQDDIRVRMKEDESLVDLMAPMTSTMASTVFDGGFDGFDGGGAGLAEAGDSRVQK